MTWGLLFWILMLFWIVFIGVWNRPATPLAWGPIGIEFVLFLCLGWAVFGAPIR